MELLQPIIDIFNAIIGLLNQLLDFVEGIVRPVTDLLERLNNLGIG